jgi:hypothetical protein
MYPHSNDLLDLVISRQREYLQESQNARLVKEVARGRSRDLSHPIWILARLGRQLASLGTRLEQRYGVVQSPYGMAKPGDCKE